MSVLHLTAHVGNLRANSLQEIEDALTEAAQCRNHLWAALACWDECDDAERRRMVEDALERLARWE